MDEEENTDLEESSLDAISQIAWFFVVLLAETAKGSRWRSRKRERRRRKQQRRQTSHLIAWYSSVFRGSFVAELTREEGKTRTQRAASLAQFADMLRGKRQPNNNEQNLSRIAWSDHKKYKLWESHSITELKRYRCGGRLQAESKESEEQVEEESDRPRENFFFDSCSCLFSWFDSPGLTDAATAKGFVAAFCFLFVLSFSLSLFLCLLFLSFLQTLHKQSKDADRKLPFLARAYLVCYNLFCAISWSIIIFVAVRHCIDKKPVETLYKETSYLLKIAQSVAVLEVVHAAVGLVRSGVGPTLAQVTSRLVVLWLIVVPFPDTQKYWGYTLLLWSWSLVEPPRYLFYVVSLIGTPPYWLTWLRYSLFAVLYPTGISGEILCILSSLPLIKKTRYLSFFMPNSWNMSFDFYVFLCFILAMYIPGGPFMYSHMVSQRRKVLSPPKEDSRKGTAPRAPSPAAVAPAPASPPAPGSKKDL